MQLRTDNRSDRGQGITARRVLIVEDEEAARTATCRYLQYRGYQVADAATVEESFARAESLRPEVLICDWKLAGERDGVHVARTLHKKYGLAVIFVTAYALADLRSHIGDLAAGVVECLRKPISLDNLAAVLDSVESDTG